MFYTSHNFNIVTFSFLDIILILGVSQGVFLSIALGLIRDRNKEANTILSMTIAIAVIMLVGRVFAARLTGDWVVNVAIAVDTTIFLFGPLMYIYVRRLIFKETPVFRLSFWHFTPAGIHAIYALLFAMLPISMVKTYQEGFTVQLIGFLIETIGLILMMAYALKCAGLLRKLKKGIHRNLSYDLRVRPYLQWLIGTLIVIVTLWLISYLCGYFLRIRLPYINYTTVWVSIPLFIYVIGYFSLRQPALFRVPIAQKPKNSSTGTETHEKARLKPDEIRQLQKRLHYFMQEEKIYKESDLSLKNLAQKLNTTSNNLSWLLNQVYQKTFYDYINEHRVKAVLVSLDRGVHLKQTLLAIAFEAGFNSKSTFNKSFKTVTSQTPTEYLKTRSVA
jgi:AraC-like DNA-binding protein